jgi:TonB-dependent SusC/RagA subfamily outer membrane receptor
MKPQILFILMILLIPVSFGQTNPKKISISGVVFDSNKQPVEGAKITIDGIQTGESTNSKGFYKIKIKPGAEKIGIYTVPPASIEESINGRASINFELNDSIAHQIYSQIDLSGEEDVNVGYGTQKRKNSTSSIKKIDGTDDRYANYTSIYDMLRGEVPGISVVGNSVIVQGVNSMTLSSEVLYVVNGTPVNSIENISPREVKSIDVLKGPAAAIYGSRGGNGVIKLPEKKYGNNRDVNHIRPKTGHNR